MSTLPLFGDDATPTSPRVARAERQRQEDEREARARQAHDAVLAAAAAALRARGQDQPASAMQAKLDLSQAHPAHTARTIRGMYRPK